MLEENEHTHFVDADFIDPEKLFANPTVAAHLELDRPMGLLMVGILHLVDEDAKPQDFVAQYLERMAPGSYVAIAQMTMPGKDSENRDSACGFFRP
ncbi:SAM-dependent methyltransferase [Fodinicola feengrottensis]|uniref:SAM-dependent methyltransferase n=1 Tax=Fodinicola feengrottensis TaxID=435914 RepID=UPI0024431ED1|nr:SAM-dependent methyltransferase [Fodinicola feengrottensis]